MVARRRTAHGNTWTTCNGRRKHGIGVFTECVQPSETLTYSYETQEGSPIPFEKGLDAISDKWTVTKQDQFPKYPFIIAS